MWRKPASGWRNRGEFAKNRLMSNVVLFRRPAPPAARARCDVISVADDLFATLDGLQDLAERAALMGRPAIEVERTVRNLRDAVGALERALDCLGEGSEAAPA
ncbi:hypothetical protein GCM10007887_12440 [Methylobacterium haplocladii]|uniref:Uncharacterized protein n=2 Tax=Methylobacterium haplocladii TaxID=1176176 RepID=A0A512IPG9_9HYPH|nr:hypothetical protein MHA02_19920 [Methylobacterium haplocladii]GJD85895.1 hypothetical protein HPGCJGGD_3790 [Methylobacterium haplocladii]GLS58580.1 hypothetical protein GCM10007887_12440 [Methylobacterium haplocladii]